MSATEVFNRAAVAPIAVPALYGQVLRAETFETADHRGCGQVVVYGGHPSWVYMNVDVANYDGRLVCMLQSDSGDTVAVGTIDVHPGVGEFSRTVPVDVARLRGARLTTTNGSVVASATFA